MNWTYRSLPIYNYWLDEKYPCKIVDKLSPTHMIVELKSGERKEVRSWQLKKKPDQAKLPKIQTPQDNLCPNCGKLSKYTNICEHCESKIN